MPEIQIPEHFVQRVVDKINAQSPERRAGFASALRLELAKIEFQLHRLNCDDPACFLCEGSPRGNQE